MASWETYDHSSSRHNDPYNKTRRPRNDSTLGPSYHGFIQQSSLHATIPMRDGSRAPNTRDHSRELRRWPPPPSVEDEKDSLRREYNPHRTDYDRIPSRGSIEQEPLLIDVPGHTPDRRFVWVPSAKKSPETHSTPPTSDDERASRRNKHKGPRIETTGLPEMRREASPYAWTKPTPSSQTPARTSEGLFLSPDSITPPAAPKSTPSDRPPPTSLPRSEWPDPSRRPQTLPTRDGSPPRSTSQHVYEGRSTAEATRSADDHIPQRPSTRYSWTKADHPHSSPSTPFNPPARDPPRRQSGPSEGYPNLNDYSRKPAPPQVINLQQSERPTSYPRHSSETSHNLHDTFPPSRTSSSDKLKESYPSSIPSSIPTSRGGSIQSSPQPSPRIINPPEYPWGMGSAASAPARRAQPPSRLAESSVPKSPRPQASRSMSSPYSPLPYPDDDSPFEIMPSEKDHQYFPEQPSGIMPPFSEPVSRVSTPKQPPLSGRMRPAEDKPATTGASRRERPKSADLSSTMRKERFEQLPTCKRVNYQTKYDDWYTLEGCHEFNVCPRCFKYVFDGTQFAVFFKPLPTRAPNRPRRCEFSNPWIRLAWVQTLNNRLGNLNMLKSIFMADETAEPCPGVERGMCSWFSIRDRDGHFIRRFVVCPSDVKRVEILFPGFKGLFVPLSTRYSYDEDYDMEGRFCSLRPHSNNRFAAYIDCLLEVHEAAVSAQRLPATYDFVSLVRHKSRFPECIRDDTLQKSDWYYIPSLAPALTVCEECYNDVVLPRLRSNSEVAMRFNRSKQPIRNEAKKGVSCQLYSRRMREVFRHAVEQNDMRYLARKAKDRKEVEDDFQLRCADLKLDAAELKGRSGYAISSKAELELERLQREIDAIGETWELEWE